MRAVKINICCRYLLGSVIFCLIYFYLFIRSDTLMNYLHTRSVWKVSSHFECLENWLFGLRSLSESNSLRVREQKLCCKIPLNQFVHHVTVVFAMTKRTNQWSLMQGFLANNHSIQVCQNCPDVSCYHYCLFAKAKSSVETPWTRVKRTWCGRW